MRIRVGGLLRERARWGTAAARKARGVSGGIPEIGLASPAFTPVCVCASTDSSGRAKADGRGERLLRLLRQTRCGKSERQGKPVVPRQTRAAAAATATATRTIVARVGRARVTHLYVGNLPLPRRRQHRTITRTARSPRATGEYDPRECKRQDEERPLRSSRSRVQDGEIFNRCSRRGGLSAILFCTADSRSRFGPATIV